MDYPLEHTVDERPSTYSPSRVLLRSFGLAFALEAVLVVAYAVFPYFPMEGGGDSPVGYWVFMLHLPMGWIAGSVLNLAGVWLFVVPALLAIVVWTVAFYTAAWIWRALR